MRRAARSAAAPLALAALLLCGDLAGADPSPPSGAAATQIGQAGTPQTDTGAEQLSGHAARPSNAAGVSQLTAPPSHPAAPAQIIRPAAGHNTQVSVVVGHDRCDPASPDAKAPECARIPERRPDDFQSGPTDATVDTVHPDAPSQDLVNGILSSGTGTVVQLPQK